MFFWKFFRCTRSMKIKLKLCVFGPYMGTERCWRRWSPYENRLKLDRFLSWCSFSFHFWKFRLYTMFKSRKMYIKIQNGMNFYAVEVFFSLPVLNLKNFSLHKIVVQTHVCIFRGSPYFCVKKKTLKSSMRCYLIDQKNLIPKALIGLLLESKSQFYLQK